MFSRKKKDTVSKTAPEAPKAPTRKSGTGIPSIISADLKILGNVVSDGVVDLDGVVEGNVKCHTATVRKNGHIKGDVVAEVVHVYGCIQGLIKARNVHFFKGCRAEGVIMHESITIEDGAFVDGRFKRTDNLVLDDEEEASVDVATLPAGEPKKLFGPGSSSFDDSGFKAPSFLSSSTDDEDDEEEDSTPGMVMLDDDEDEEDAPKETSGKAKKRESVLDNLRLISDVN